MPQGGANASSIDFEQVRRRLAEGEGGYEVVHASPYVVLDGRGTLEIEGETVELAEGKAVFVPAGAEHHFVGYESLSVLVIFTRPR
ncbi:MAG: cupin domain-containing protein [Thermoleophilaceae bacterium]